MTMQNRADVINLKVNGKTKMWIICANGWGGPRIVNKEKGLTLSKAVKIILDVENYSYAETDVNITQEEYERLKNQQ